MEDEQEKLECTCDDLTELERYYGEHYDGCPLSDFTLANSSDSYTTPS